MERIELEELACGAMQEQFNRAFERVIENLQNPNTPYKNTREIVIKMKFTQNEQRDDVKCGISVMEKLAPQCPMETGFAIGKNIRTGEVYAMEYGRQVKGQIAMDMEAEADEEEIDAETGEISQKNDGVIDLRRQTR